MYLAAFWNIFPASAVSMTKRPARRRRSTQPSTMNLSVAAGGTECSVGWVLSDVLSRARGAPKPDSLPSQAMRLTKGRGHSTTGWNVDWRGNGGESDRGRASVRLHPAASRAALRKGLRTPDLPPRTSAMSVM